jgi:hypothetical protein
LQKITYKNNRKIFGYNSGFYLDFYNNQNSKSKLGQTEKANDVLLFLNYFSTVKFLKLKYFCIKKYYEKEKNKFESIWSLGRHPNDLFTLYFLYLLLFIDSWAELILRPRLIFFYS